MSRLAPFGAVLLVALALGCAHPPAEIPALLRTSQEVLDQTNNPVLNAARQLLLEELQSQEEKFALFRSYQNADRLARQLRGTLESVQSQQIPAPLTVAPSGVRRTMPIEGPRSSEGWRYCPSCGAKLEGK